MITGSNDLRDATDKLIVQATVDQYYPTFAAHSTPGTVVEQKNFDAIRCNDTLVLAWSNGAGSILVKTLASEDGGDQAWSAATTLTPVPGVDDTVVISLASDDSSIVRIFYYDGADIMLFTNSAKGVGDAASWGAAQSVVTIASVVCLSAPKLTRVQYGVSTGAKYNIRLRCSYYSGFWADLASDVWWQSTIDTFRACSGPSTDITSSTGNDIIALSGSFPALIGRTLEGKTLAYTLDEAQGIAIFRYQNGHWSEHWPLDEVDEIISDPARARGRLSVHGDTLFLTYQRVLGSTDHISSLIAISRSKDGIRWEQPYMLTRESDMSNDVIVLPRGNHVYLINSRACYRSALTSFFGTPATTLDISDYILSLSMNAEDSNRMEATLSNANEQLESLSPLADDVSMRLTLTLGYRLAGGDETVQVGRFDVDSISKIEDNRSKYWQLSCRGVAGRFQTIIADHIAEWQSQTQAADDFECTDTTDYSGLRHAAVMQGKFDTPNGQNYLRLISGDSEGIAFSTSLSNAWHGTIESGIYCANLTTAYVGLLCRVYDQNNFIAVTYFPPNYTTTAYRDKITIGERRNGTSSLIYTSSAMGWAVETWYYLRVRFRYGYVLVQTSTDGVSWTTRVVQEMPGLNGDWTWSNFAAGGVPFMAGRVGFVGRGYVEGGTSTRWKAVRCNDNCHPISLEGALRTFGAFAGVHDFDVEALLEEGFADLGDWTVDGAATWDVSSSTLNATAGGAAGHVYTARYDVRDFPPAFVAHFDHLSGVGGFIFHCKDGANDCLMAWWDSATCGFSYVNDAGGATTLIQMPWGLPAGVPGMDPAFNRITVKTGWRTDTIDDTKTWMLMSMYCDGIELVSYALEYAGTAYEWDGDEIGFAVWSSNNLVVDNLYMEALYREVEYMSCDPGEPIGAGVQRAVATTRLRLSELYDGTLRIRKSMNASTAWTVPASRVRNFRERDDKIQTRTHVRVIGATYSVDALDADEGDVHGHMFEQLDDPNLVSEKEVWAEAMQRLYDAEEEQCTAALVMDLQPLTEVYDVISWDSRLWRVLAVKHDAGASRNRFDHSTTIEMRKYVSRTLPEA